MDHLKSKSLPSVEDKLSVVLSRLEKIENSLRELNDIKQVLRDIESNTHPNDDSKSVGREDKTEKVIVGIRASVISVGDIDTVGQQFKCDLYLSACWAEPRLQGKTTEDLDWNNEWHPRIVFFNALEIEKVHKNHFLIYEEGNEIPYACETYRMKGSFRENLELWDFPLDYQELTITLMSDWTNKQVKFEKDLKKADNIRPETFTADQEWFLCRHVVTESTDTIKTEGSSANDYPLYHIKCHVKRKNGYYLWNIAMIIFLIDILSFCSFSVDISSPSDRLSVTLTLLLTAVAFKFVVSQSLPTISYLTLLDKYVLSGLIFLGFMAIENAVAAVIPNPDDQKMFDRICLYIGIGCFLCIHVIAVVLVVVKSKARNKALYQSAKDFREQQQRVNDYAVERQRRLEQRPPKEQQIPGKGKVVLVDSSS
ncbi:Cys-loop ligand-gated ion channel [Acropora cervicornis]|uniref:Cys-loop ligand-gated ion channel n=1 Tax=Acropora cervicornis TaxID=6130 RepID=A0AAD9Q2Q7_ACRCE|nr:Cys-loop ligand-gated ion channel [Acropora cervicornis]